MSNAHFALSQITPTEAHTLLKFMQGHVPEPRKLDPAMTRQESAEMDNLMDKIRLVLSFRADEETGIAHLIPLVAAARARGWNVDKVLRDLLEQEVVL